MTETAHHHTVHTPAEATRDLLNRLTVTGGGLLAIILLAILAVAGAVRLILLAMPEPEPPTSWGYAVAILAFLMSTAQAAPILAFATRLAKGYWGIPLRRAADLLGLSGLVTTPLFIIILFQLPDFHGRTSTWNDWPYAPHLYDAVAICLLTITNLAIIWLTSVPDLAAARDTRGSRLASFLAMGWTGTKRRWNILTTGTILLGSFYLMWFVYVHMYLASDLAMALVPGWHSSIFPAYHAVSSLQAGAAATLLTLLILRRLAGLERYVGVDPFWGASKLLLGTSLLFFYFTWSEFIPMWYGRLPYEMNVLGVLMFGPFLPLFGLSFVLNFVLPFALLIWNPIRKSIMGPTFVAMLILTGNFIDRVRIYLSSWSVAGPVGMSIEVWPPIRPPALGDLAIIVGALSALMLLYLLALRVVPPVSLWEHKSALLLTVERRFIKTEVAVVAKPR